MKKNIKVIIGITLGILIGASTIVGAATIFRSEDITYSSPTNKTNVKDSLDELYSKVGQCPDGWHCFETTGIAAKVELGDYIRMTPTRTSYTISKDLTGTSSDQIINPSGLNLWRVIRKNEDGTVEAISEYVSSENVTFQGETGYINFVGVLNQIAAQYTNEKYIENTRHIGYNGQTEYITDTSSLSVELPWKKDTSIYGQWLNCDSDEYLCGVDESKGAGDVGYVKDYKLVNSVYGMMKASTIERAESRYWLASRYYIYNTENRPGHFGGRLVNENGGAGGRWLYRRGDMIDEISAKIRPILTLKANDKIVSGDGKSIETAYRFE